MLNQKTGWIQLPAPILLIYPCTSSWTILIMSCPQTGFSVSGPGSSIRSRDCQWGGRIRPSWLVSIWWSRRPKNTAVALFTPHILACRYRDNIYLFGQKSVLFQRLPEFQHTLASIYCMPVQFEQMGSCIHVLEVSQCLHPKNDIHPQLHSKVLSVANISRSNVQRWPDPWSPNAPSVLPSLCLGLASKCDFWA